MREPADPPSAIVIEQTIRPRTRRRVLRDGSTAIALSLGGCLSPKRATTETPVGFQVSVLRSFSRESPARLTIRLSNRRRRPISVWVGPTSPFWELLSASGPRGSALILIPDEYHARDEIVPSTPQGACWKARDRIVRTPTLREETLRVGETVAQAYTILAPMEQEIEACFEPGEYQFEQSLAVGTAPDEPSSGIELAFGIELDGAGDVTVTSVLAGRGSES